MISYYKEIPIVQMLVYSKFYFLDAQGAQLARMTQNSMSGSKVNLYFYSITVKNSEWI